MDSDKITYHELMEAFLSKPGRPGASVKERIAEILGESEFSPVMKKLDWLGLFSKKKISTPNASPALILEELLLEKWKLAPKDKDLILMQHEFFYELKGKKYHLTSTMALKGMDAEDTAMSRLVGLPLGIFAKFLMTKRIVATGVNIPVTKEIYEPVLEELKEYGVIFYEKEVELKD
jgi:saccharopine dehydrogenase (NADP+, L-glutamate forming)